MKATSRSTQQTFLPEKTPIQKSLFLSHQMETHILKIRSVPVITLQLHFLFSSFKIKPASLHFTDPILDKGRPFHSQMKRYQIDKEMPQGQYSHSNMNTCECTCRALSTFFFSQVVHKPSWKWWLILLIRSWSPWNNTVLQLWSYTLEMVIFNFTPTYRKNQSFPDFENNSEVWNLAVDRMPSNSQAVSLYQDVTSGSSYSWELVFKPSQIAW